MENVILNSLLNSNVALKGKRTISKPTNGQVNIAISVNI